MDGQSIAGYRILGKIAEGAQGTVYEALHERMGRRVALKFLRREAMLDPDDRRRFEHEARITARLDHSSICQIYDYDEAQGQVFLAMPYLEGENLRTLLQAGPLRLEEAVLIAIQVAEGLHEAHRQGVIHRDIKPSNIMITGADTGHTQAKILDFGLARSHDMTVLTRTDTAVGTAAYMSPEQVMGRPLDARTDLWSLGAVLYEMVAGHRPFPGDTPQAMCYGITHERPAPIGRLRPESRPELRRIIGRLLEREPRNRYQDADELLRDLRALRREMTTTRSPFRDWLWKYRNRLAVAAACLLFLTVAIVGALLGLDRLPRPTPALGRPRQVTFGDEWEGEPALSPDGSRIAFASFNGTDHDICWVGIKGGDPVPISTGPADDRDPSWLPDGSGLVFTSDRGGRIGIWKMDLSGGSTLEVIPDAHYPAVSLDGARLAFVRPDSTGHYRVCVAPLAEPANWRQVSSSANGVWSHFTPAFSPDGTTICFTDYHNLWLLDPAGGEIRALTNGGTWDANPAWSPEGRHVYFSSRRDGSQALWRIAATGGQPVRLTPGSGPETHPNVDPAGRWLAYGTEKEAVNVLLVDRRGESRLVTTGWAQSQQPALAPDVSFVVYVAMRQGRVYSLWRRELADGRAVGSEAKLTDHNGGVSHPVISHDGRWIAYYVIDPATGNRDIWIVPAHGGAPSRVTSDPAPDSGPAWAPDDRRLSFCSERDGLPAIFTIAIEEGRPVGDPVRISPHGLAADYSAWSPDGQSLVFLGTADTTEDAFVIPAAGNGEPVRLTVGVDIHMIRWIPGSGEIWASASWGDGGVSVRRLDPAGSGSAPLDPPLKMPAGTPFGWFNTDASGRWVVLNDDHRVGDIWVLEAEEGERF
jgi:Tol biopolymer transport system component/tRNA A-37 threonylcarbamoyl transferase component Bud32